MAASCTGLAAWSSQEFAYRHDGDQKPHTIGRRALLQTICTVYEQASNSSKSISKLVSQGKKFHHQNSGVSGVSGQTLSFTANSSEKWGLEMQLCSLLWFVSFP